MSQKRRSDYKTGKEYRWARKAQAKEQTAPIRAAIWLAAIVLTIVWIASGSFIAGATAAAALVLFIVVMIFRADRRRAKAP